MTREVKFSAYHIFFCYFLCYHPKFFFQTFIEFVVWSVIRFLMSTNTRIENSSHMATAEIYPRVRAQSIHLIWFQKQKHKNVMLFLHRKHPHTYNLSVKAYMQSNKSNKQQNFQENTEMYWLLTHSFNLSNAKSHVRWIISSLVCYHTQKGIIKISLFI